MSPVLITGGACDIDRRRTRDRWAHLPIRTARLDRLSALALLAVDEALLDAALGPARWDPDRVAIVVGTAFGCHATNEEFYRGLLREGLLGASPRLFANTLPSSPGGEISIHYGTRGVVETSPGGRQAGLEAIDRGARLLELGHQAVIVVAVDVASATLGRLGLAAEEGAAAVILEAGASDRGGRATPLRLLASGASFDSGGLATVGDHPDLPSLQPPPGDDAVAPLATLIRWWRAARPGDAAAVVAVDGEGGAAAVACAVLPPTRSA